MARPTPQEIEDIRKQKKIDEAYDKSLTSPEMVAPPPAKPASAPVTPKKYAKGGYVRSADGVCRAGKTRGNLV